MKITKEINKFNEIEVWSGAKYTYEIISKNYKQEEFMALLEEMFTDGCSETELNYFFWFDDEYILSALDIKQNWWKNDPVLYIQGRVVFSIILYDFKNPVFSF